MFVKLKNVLNLIKIHFYGISKNSFRLLHMLIVQRDKTVSMVIITQFDQIEFN